MKYMERGERRIKSGKSTDSHPAVTEGLFAAVILVLVLLLAFLINSFFYGFDFPQVSRGDVESVSLSRYVTFSEMSLHTQESRLEAAAEEIAEHPELWNLTLVNRSNPIDDETVPELTVLRRGVRVDKRIYPSLQQMFDDMRAQGLRPIAEDGYHTREEHEQILAELAKDYEQAGISPKKAEEMAVAFAGEAGANEHELGISVDITSEKGDSVSEAAVLSWLEKHSWEYGFILRYPEEKSQITGNSANPNHYRYVGPEAARVIYEKNLTLEEYLLTL